VLTNDLQSGSRPHQFIEARILTICQRIYSEMWKIIRIFA